MKKILSVILSFCCFWALSAQTISTKPVTAKPFPSVTPDLNLIRHNYKNNQYTYTGTERIYINAGKGNLHPFYMKLDLIGFPDGSDVYMMELDFVETKSVVIPKGVKMTVSSSTGKIMSSKQMGTDSDKHSFNDNGTQVYWNKVQYVFSPEDIARMAAGVKHIDVATGWGIDDYISISFVKDEFGSAIKKQVAAIKTVKRATKEIGDNIAQYADRFGSTTIVSKPVKLEGKKYAFTIALNYLYYKDTNKEDYDLNFLIKGAREYDIPVDSPVTFELSDGSIMNLKQEQDDKDAVHCYPTIDQVKTLLRGVRSLRVDTADGSIKEVFSENEFAKILDLQYNSLQVVSPL